jgi:D-amino peptidase
MKVLISADMEGVTGVTTWDQVTPGHPEYSRFRRLMTGDVNAAIRGAFAGGADEVTVADGHWDGSNILIEELDPRAHLNSGAPSPASMMQGIEAGIAGVMFVGYHARHGSERAVLDHTWSSSRVMNVWLNGSLAGEYTLNAAIAGHYGAPVVLATGDQTACAQMTELLGPVDIVVVKQATSRFSAECLPPTETQAQIQGRAKSAVERLAKNEAVRPFKVKSPIELIIELHSSDMADRACKMPGSKREGLRVVYTASDMVEAYAAFRSLVSLSYDH